MTPQPAIERDARGRLMSFVYNLMLSYYKKFNEKIAALFHGTRAQNAQCATRLS
jgi:hypothetical protein